MSEEEKSLKDILAELRKGQGTGGFIDRSTARGDFAPIIKDIEMSAARLVKALDGGPEVLAAAKKGMNDFKTAMTSMSSGDVQGMGKAVTSMATQLDKVLKSSVGAAVALIGDIVGVGADLVTVANKKMAQAMTGVQGAFTAFTSTMTSGFKAMGGSFAKIGDMLDGILGNAIAAIIFQLEDARLAAKSRLRESSRTGEEGRPTSMANAVTGQLRGSLGRDATEEMVTGLAEMGALQQLRNEKDAKNISQLKEMQASNRVLRDQQLGEVDTLLKIGMTRGISNADMRKQLEEQQTLTTDNASAAKQLSEIWGASQNIVKGTNLSLNDTAKILKDTAMSARFMNVDMKTLANTMKIVADSQSKMSAMGMGKADMGKVVGDWTDASAKATDALHMFFGTKGGTEGGDDPFKGMLASKMGSTFAGSLKATGGGGFTAETGKSGDMFENNLKVMKDYMEQASAGASTDAEKFAIQQRVATDVFKMGAEGAKVLAMQDSSKLDEITKNEHVVRGFKTDKDYLSQLVTQGTRDENIKRVMSEMSLNQLDAALDSVGYLSEIALATVAAVTEKGEEGDSAAITNFLKKEKGGKSGSQYMLDKITEDLVKMRGNFSDVTKQLANVVGDKRLNKAAVAAENMERVGDKSMGGPGLTRGEKAIASKKSETVVDDIMNGPFRDTGVVTAGKSYILNKGLEIFTPGASGYITPPKESREIMDGLTASKSSEPMNLTGKETHPLGNNGTTVTLNFTGVLNEAALLEMMVDATRKAVFNGGS